MYKKQILKIGHSRKSKVASCLVLSFVLIGTIAANVSAGNITDREYEYTCGPNGFATSTEEKWDYTSAYIYHQGNSAAYVQVRSNGINYSANGGSYYVSPGQQLYLPNYVKENGADNCYLYLTPSSSQWVKLYGVWSPDSV